MLTSRVESELQYGEFGLHVYVMEIVRPCKGLRTCKVLTECIPC